MTYVITQSCCNDAGCVAVCPVDCIHPRPDDPQFAGADMLYIDPDACVDCGACAEVCPVDAIVADHALTSVEQPYADIARAYFAETPKFGSRMPAPALPVGARASSRRLRVAIVGTGPAAAYAAQGLWEREGDAVTMSVFDKLPAAGGLMRYGIAPDHERTKGVANAFERRLKDARIELFLNVEIGSHLSHAELLNAHHAVIYATGASEGLGLAVAGAALAGHHPAADVVGWYNGHPDHAYRDIDLTGHRALVVGNGNVALDVARILLADAATLAASDIPQPARMALSASRIEEVMILGRGSPERIAATAPELMALRHLRDVDVVVEGRLPPIEALPPGTDGVRARVRALHDLAAAQKSIARRRIILSFNGRPIAIEGEKRVAALRVARRDPETHEDAIECLTCDLLISAIGYQVAPIIGLPFDRRRGVVANLRGRVIDCEGAISPGVYVAGWAKRGPTGGLGANRVCASETIDNLVSDFQAGLLADPAMSPIEFDTLIAGRQPDRVDRAGWRRMDATERAAGRAAGRKRDKLVDVARMVAVANALLGAVD